MFGFFIDKRSAKDKIDGSKCLTIFIIVYELCLLEEMKIDTKVPNEIIHVCVCSVVRCS